MLDEVEGKLSVGFNYLGEQPVNNVEKLVRIYRVRREVNSVLRVSRDCGDVRQQSPYCRLPLRFGPRLTRPSSYTCDPLRILDAALESPSSSMN